MTLTNLMFNNWLHKIAKDPIMCNVHGSVQIWYLACHYLKVDTFGYIQNLSYVYVYFLV